MQFNSIEFLLFFPIVFMLYWSLLRYPKAQNWLIIFCSYFFYGWWDWHLLYLIILTSFCSWGSGLLIHRFRDKGKFFLLFNVCLNIGILCLFKYYDFFVNSLNNVLSFIGVSVQISTLRFIVPVGISFYTFQALSYSIDVYRRTIIPTREISAFFAYICFFPQLVAGPIERAGNLLGQFESKRHFEFDEAADGIRQMLWGYFLKSVLADNCASIANVVFDHADVMNWHGMFFGILFFAFQIYGDFAGYSHIAIGSARLLGFSLLDNFRSPYISHSIQEFWRRWHISLNTWFRDYVYIPLGGNRCGFFLKIRNILITFTLSGLWHGANWTYIVWGFYNGLLTLIPAREGKQKSISWFSIPITFCLVLIGWTIFRSSSVSQAFSIIAKIAMFQGGVNVLDFGTVSHVVYFLSFILMAIVVMLDYLSRNLHHPLQALPRFNIIIRWLIYLILTLFILLFIGQPTPFIYFQF